jgi:hypothetical protein
MNVSVDIAELRAAAADRAVKDSTLEWKACALIKQYGFFLPAPAKEFFRELAAHLNWQHLGKLL